MKVDMKIVPVEVEEKSGWFSKKKRTMHQLQTLIILTDVEKAIIEKAGLRDFIIQEVEYHSPDGSYSEILQHKIGPWCDDDGWSYQDYETLIEAQSYAQQLKANLVKLKEAMELHTDTPTEESFEL